MSRTTAALAALCVTSAVIALVVHLGVFPHGSIDNDEGVYLLQAKALRSGHFFLPGTGLSGQPWFFAFHDSDLVGKYLPVLPAMYTLALVTTGTTWPALMLVAGLFPLTTYALAREVRLERGPAWAAAGVVALSPLTIVQSGLLLSYLPFAVCMSLLWLVLLRLLNGRLGVSGAWTAGLLAVGCASLRPYDTVLLVLPFLIAFLRRSVARKVATAAYAAAGALPLLVVLGLYNRAATGSPLRLPFSLFSSGDKIGYGTRRSYAEDPPHRFGVREALQGAYHHFLLGSLSWFALGALLVPALVLLVFRRCRTDRDRNLMLWSAGLFLLGYLVFWGPYSASIIWRGPRFVGPFYAFALLVPVVVFGMPLLVAGFRRQPVIGAVLVVAALSINGFQLVTAFRGDARDGRRTAAVLSAIDTLPRDDVLLVQADPAYLGHPVSAINLRSDMPGLHLAPRTDPSALDPSRQVALLLLDPGFYDRAITEPFALVPQRRVSADRLQFQIAGPSPADVVAVAVNGRIAACAGAVTVTAAVDTPGTDVTCTGKTVAAPDFPALAPCPTARCLDVLAFPTDEAGRAQPPSLRRLVVGTGGGSAGLTAYVDQAGSAASRFASITSS